MGEKAAGHSYKAGAKVSVLTIDERPVGVIVINPGERPAFYRYEGGSEELAVAADGRIIIPILIKPGSSLSVMTAPEFFEIQPSGRERRGETRH